MAEILALTAVILGCALFLAIIVYLIVAVGRDGQERKVVKVSPTWEETMVRLQEYRPSPSPKRGPAVHHLKANDLNVMPPRTDDR